MNKTLLKKYAQLIAVKGINVQKGQGVIITAAVDQQELVCAIAQQCYKAGAKWVDVEWTSQELEKIAYRSESVKQLSEVPRWKREKYQMMVEELPATILVLSDDPDGLSGVNKDKLQKATVARRKVRKFYMDQYDGKQQWLIVAAPSEKWAQKVFPGMRKSAAVEKLWDAILQTVRVTKDNDPLAAWDEHNRNLKARYEKLNSMKLDRLVYKSSNGTDFTVGLNPNALWMGGEESTQSGVLYNPNMPSEEIFTSPMKGRAEGTVVATKPLSYRGQLIENFSITFRDGKAVEVHAEKGEDILRDMISSDETAGYLGEVALIPKDSPINQSGILFYETLFDENASCHLALGAGFNNTLVGYENMTLEQCVEMGINDSIIHVDFMIGSDDLEIKGYTADGKEYIIFENGNWGI